NKLFGHSFRFHKNVLASPTGRGGLGKGSVDPLTRLRMGLSASFLKATMINTAIIGQTGLLSSIIFTRGFTSPDVAQHRYREKCFIKHDARIHKLVPQEGQIHEYLHTTRDTRKA